MRCFILINALILLSVNLIHSMNSCDMMCVLFSASEEEPSYQDKEDKEKDELLATVITTIEPEKDSNKLLNIIVRLLHAGANPNMVLTYESLLHKALRRNAELLVRVLLEHKADYKHEHCLIGPIFFDAPTPKVAKLFIDKGVDVNRVNANDCNVLWHVIDSQFPSALVHFYLKHGVNANHINKWDGSSVLHGFAAYKEVKDGKDFLTKVYYVMQKINTRFVYRKDNNGETPINVAEKTVAMWGEKYPACVKPLQKLIKIFNKVV